MSVSPLSQPRAAETVAGLMAALALFASLVGIVHRPVRVIPAALVVALIAATIGGRHERLAYAAMLVGVVAFVAGMSVATATGRPLW